MFLKKQNCPAHQGIWHSTGQNNPDEALLFVTLQFSQHVLRPAELHVPTCVNSPGSWFY